jgi:hypothetical protein
VIIRKAVGEEAEDRAGQAERPKIASAFNYQLY